MADQQLWQCQLCGYVFDPAEGCAMHDTEEKTWRRLPAQRAGHEPGDRAFQLVAPELERVDRGEVVQQRRPDAAADITATR